MGDPPDARVVSLSLRETDKMSQRDYNSTDLESKQCTINTC